MTSYIFVLLNNNLDNSFHRIRDKIDYTFQMLILLYCLMCILYIELETKYSAWSQRNFLSKTLADYHAQNLKATFFFMKTNSSSHPTAMRIISTSDYVNLIISDYDCQWEFPINYVTNSPSIEYYQRTIWGCVKLTNNAKMQLGNF